MHHTGSFLSIRRAGYSLRYMSDASAHAFVRAHCGVRAAAAWECLRPGESHAHVFPHVRLRVLFIHVFDPQFDEAGAFRADLFRMCALYTHGGVYMDTDLELLEPLESLFHSCHNLTLGYDRPQPVWWGPIWNPFRILDKMQISFLAAAPRHPLIRCHLDTIIGKSFVCSSLPATLPCTLTFHSPSLPHPATPPPIPLPHPLPDL